MLSISYFKYYIIKTQQARKSIVLKHCCYAAAFRPDVWGCGPTSGTVGGCWGCRNISDGNAAPKYQKFSLFVVNSRLAGTNPLTDFWLEWRLGTVGLASHWPHVTFISVSPPTGSIRRGRWAPAYAVSMEYCNCNWQIAKEIFPLVLWHCWLGDRKGIHLQKLGVGLLVVTRADPEGSVILVNYNYN